MTHILNGGGWVFYYIAAIVAGAIANFYVFLVAGFWVLVITGTIAIVTMSLMSAILMLPFCFVCCLIIEK